MVDDKDEITKRFRNAFDEASKQHGTVLEDSLVATHQAVELVYQFLSCAKPGKPVLLVIDDDPSVCSSWRRTTRAIGEMECVTAERLEEAMEILDRAQRIDAVVLDHMLGEGHVGLEFLEALRLVWTDVPVVVATGYDDPRIRDQYEKIGQREVYFKPKPLATRTLEKIVAERKSNPPRKSPPGGTPKP